MTDTHNNVSDFAEVQIKFGQDAYEQERLRRREAKRTPEEITAIEQFKAEQLTHLENLMTSELHAAIFHADDHAYQASIKEDIELVEALLKGIDSLKAKAVAGEALNRNDELIESLMQAQLKNDVDIIDATVPWFEAGQIKLEEDS